MRVLLVVLLSAATHAQEHPPAAPIAVGSLLTVRAGPIGSWGALVAVEGRRLLEQPAGLGRRDLGLSLHPSMGVFLRVEVAPGAALHRRAAEEAVVREARTLLETKTRTLVVRRDGQGDLDRDDFEGSLARREVVRLSDQRVAGRLVRVVERVEHELDLDGAGHRATSARLGRPARAADPELAGLLPGQAVALGESWPIPADAVRDALLPAGELDLVFARGRNPNWYPTLALILAGAPEGECTARLTRIRVEGGRRLAEVELELALEVVTDMGAHFASQVPTDGNGSYLAEAVDSDWLFEGGGQLVWDLDAGRASSLVLAGEVTQRYDFHYTIRDTDLEMRQEVTGRLEVSLEERPEEPEARPVVPGEARTEREDDR